jgi:undecaprenyl-diphosphatase
LGIAESVLLGIVQGLAEFLPISSSAHLIVVSEAMGGETLPLAFNVALHMGTLVAVLIYFWRDWYGLLKGVILDPVLRKTRHPASEHLALCLFIGSLPAGIIGLSFKDQIETYLHHPLVLCLPLILVGILLVWVDRRTNGQNSYSGLSLKVAFFIGVAQACALIPGVSRSGSTIIGGLWSGLSREEAAKFSFLLGTPAMLGAFLLELDSIFKVLSQPEFLVGVFASFLTGCLAINIFLKFLRRFGFGAFAIYRAILAVGIYFWFSS